MERITRKNVEGLAERINEVRGTPKITWIKDTNGKNKSNIGNYYISSAYGGVSLYQIVNNFGGVTDVFGCGHITKRDLWNRMRAFFEGCRKE